MSRFETMMEPIDVTSMHRPDTDWIFIDSSGHEHCWYEVDGGPAGGRYDVMKRYHVPTLRFIVEREATDDYPETGHHKCLQCGAAVVPEYCSDTYRQFIPGLTEYLIDGVRVTKEEFDRRVQEEGAASD